MNSKKFLKQKFNMAEFLLRLCWNRKVLLCLKLLLWQMLIWELLLIFSCSCCWCYGCGCCWCELWCCYCDAAVVYVGVGSVGVDDVAVVDVLVDSIGVDDVDVSDVAAVQVLLQLKVQLFFTLPFAWGVRACRCCCCGVHLLCKQMLQGLFMCAVKIL